MRQRTRNWVARHPYRQAVGGIVLWNYLNSYESTDDAQIDGHLNPITPRISGTMVGVYVENNQFVTAGHSLVDLDDREYKVALQQAKGAYEQARARWEAGSRVAISGRLRYSDRGRVLSVDSRHIMRGCHLLGSVL